jgi:adenosylcobinamide kinase/adenosylcobinamide-phosphate guanylyltransferase
VVLLDGYDGLERAAAQLGRDLRDVRHVLLSRPPEGTAGWLDAVGGTAPVDVHGPAAALEPLRCLSDRLRLVEAPSGDRQLAVGGYRARAVQHGQELAWDVVAPDGKRLLYAAGSGLVRLTREESERPYDLVLLGLGRSEPGAAPALAQLRREGLVQPTTDVRAFGYSHHAELPDVLQHHLAGWGVGGTADGLALTEASRDPDGHARSGRTLVLGGVRSGKSALAEQLLAAQPHVTYVAAGGSRADDAEWQQRVALHRARRPGSWRTVETTDLTACLRAADGAVLVDCLGTWLTALLDRHGIWAGGTLAPVEAEMEELVATWRTLRVPLVAVSNEVGSGVVPATAAGRLFRDLLGRLNATVARESETVLLTVAGIPVPLRPGRIR